MPKTFLCIEVLTEGGQMKIMEREGRKRSAGAREAVCQKRSAKYGQ